jgi:outer membrane PBP1 activator LpoA protein
MPWKTPEASPQFQRRAAMSCLSYVTFAKVAHILPMTGPFTTTGRQVEAGAPVLCTLLPPAAQSLRACDTMFIVSRFTLAFYARR